MKYNNHQYIFIGKGKGFSMTPVINPGDKLFINKNNNTIKVGDIIVFYQNKSFVGHRVIKKGGGIIIAKGDNCFFCDKPLKYNQVLGKVVKIEGVYGKIDLTSHLAGIMNMYFMFYSLATYYFPLFLQKGLTKIIKGRKILIKLIATH